MSSGFKKMWFKKGILWEVIFILTILYAVSSINILVIVISILPFLHGAFLKTHILTYFAEIAFGLTAFLSVYHITTIFHRRKRRTDRQEG